MTTSVIRQLPSERVRRALASTPDEKIDAHEDDSSPCEVLHKRVYGATCLRLCPRYDSAAAKRVAQPIHFSVAVPETSLLAPHILLKSAPLQGSFDRVIKRNKPLGSRLTRTERYPRVSYSLLYSPSQKLLGYSLRIWV